MLYSKSSNLQKTVFALTQGKNEPSSRFRWRQYIPYLIESGIIPFEKCTYWESYPPKRKLLRPPWLVANSFSALKNTICSNNYDLRFLQRELISTLCTAEPLLKDPFVFDVDDAIFLHQRFSSIDRIAKRANLIICGNEFLANYFSSFGNVKILPTAVDTKRFVPKLKSNESIIIGWSGSSSGLTDLYTIEPALKIILDKYPNIYIKVISDRQPTFTLLPKKQLIFQQWHPETEVDAIQDITIGIMPLSKGEWVKGKCSYKMLTYMAVGVPVVVSSIGMNIDVLQHGNAGMLVSTIDEWVDAITFLLNKQSLAKEMGLIGRQVIEKYYATNIIGPKLAKILIAQM